MKWARLFLCSAAAFIVSCQVRYTDENMEKVGTVINSRRAVSMSVWKEKTIRGLSPHAYAGLVTAMALPPDSIVRWKESQGPAGSVRVRINIKPSNNDAFMGSAVPITHDGYFLTAAHCADNLTSIQLGILTRDKTYAIVRARVIWKSAGPSEKGPDVALLHAPLVPFLAMNMADPDQLRIGLPVLTSGCAENKRSQSGGKIISLGQRETDSSGAHWRRMGHSAPTAVGDSGGPVIGPDGQLLAITTAGYWRVAFPLGLQQVWGYQGVSVAPDPVWIMSLIKQDRVRQKIKRST